MLMAWYIDAIGGYHGVSASFHSDQWLSLVDGKLDLSECNFACESGICATGFNFGCCHGDLVMDIAAIFIVGGLLMYKVGKMFAYSNIHIIYT